MITTSKQFLEDFNKVHNEEQMNLILIFFIAFSRFEYALKRSNFIITSNNRVSPNWNQFINRIRTDFDEKDKPETVKIAIKYIIENPTKIQTNTDGVLTWQQRTIEANTPEIIQLLLSIKNVRNNLFHGGKFSGNLPDDSARNSLLLKHSITILDYWLELNNNIKETFLDIR